MIRNEVERRNAEKRADYLRSELGKRPCDGQSEATRGVMGALHMQLSDVEKELDEYERLKQSTTSVLKVSAFDDLGELLIKARISRGWSQADLATALDMEPQQVQRYEKDDWQKISFWRLQEVVEALELVVEIRADLSGEAPKRPGALWVGTTFDRPSNAVVYEDSALTISKEAAAGDRSPAATSVAQDSAARDSEADLLTTAS